MGGERRGLLAALSSVWLIRQGSWNWRAAMAILRFLVADDHAVVRKGLCSILQEQPGWIVAAEASDGYEAVQKCLEIKPHIVIMDIGMPILNGLEATRQ